MARLSRPAAGAGVAALALLCTLLAILPSKVHGCPADSSTDSYYSTPGTYQHPDVPGLLALSCAFTKLSSFGADFDPCSQNGQEQGLQISCGSKDAQGRNRVTTLVIPSPAFLPIKAAPSQLPSGWTFALPSLTSLQAAYSDAPQAAPRDYLQDWIPVWRTAFPSLQLLNLQNTGASGTGWQGICTLPTLQGVFLSSNRLTGGLPTCLSALSHLTTLDLYDNALTGPLPPQLGRSLQTLRLSNNLLEGAYPPAWPASSPDLEHIELQNNQFTGGVPATWHLFAKTRFIDFRGNRQRGKLPMKWRRRFCLHKPDATIYFGAGFEFTVLSNSRVLAGNACANPHAKKFVMIAWLAFGAVVTLVLGLMFLELALRRGEEREDEAAQVQAQAYPPAVSSPPGAMKEISLQSREFRMDAPPTHLTASAGGPPLGSPRHLQKPRRCCGLGHRLHAIVDGPSRLLLRTTESHVWHAVKVLVSMVDIVSDVFVAVNLFPRPIFVAMVFSIIFPDLVAACCTHIHWVRCARRHPAAVRAPRWAPYRFFAALPAPLRPLTLIPALPFLLPFLPVALLIQLALNVAGSSRRIVDALDAATYLHVYSWMVALVEAPIQTALVSWFFVQGNTVKGGYYTSTVIFVTSIATSLADMAIHLIKARNLVYTQGTLSAIPSHFRDLIHEMGHPSGHFKDSDRPPGAGRPPGGHYPDLDPFPDTPPHKRAAASGANNPTHHPNGLLTSNDDIYANPIHSASFSKARRQAPGGGAASPPSAPHPSRTASWVSNHRAAAGDAAPSPDHLPLRGSSSTLPPEPTPRSPSSPPRLRTPRLRASASHRSSTYKAFVAEAIADTPAAPSPDPLPRTGTQPPRRPSPPEPQPTQRSLSSSSGSARRAPSSRSSRPDPAAASASPPPRTSASRSGSYNRLGDAAGASGPMADVDLHRSTSSGTRGSAKYRTIDEALAMAASESFRSSQGATWQR